MPKLLSALATATILLIGSGIIWKAEAATMTNVGTLAPLTKSYASVEKVTYWRRAYRRGYYGYGYPGYAYPAYPYYGYGAYPAYPYYGYGYRPYGYYGGGPGVTIGIGPRWGWGY